MLTRQRYVVKWLISPIWRKPLPPAADDSIGIWAAGRASPARFEWEAQLCVCVYWVIIGAADWDRNKNWQMLAVVVVGPTSDKFVIFTSTRHKNDSKCSFRENDRAVLSAATYWTKPLT